MTYADFHQGERRIRQLEDLLAQQRRLAAELEKFDPETRAEVEQGLLHERSVHQMIAQSEPTTPPEYQDVFPSLSLRSSVEDVRLIRSSRSIESAKSILNDQHNFTSWSREPPQSLEHPAHFACRWLRPSVYCHDQHKFAVAVCARFPTSFG